MAPSMAVVVGDVGGTNARLQLYRCSKVIENDSTSMVDVLRKTYRTSIYSGLSSILKKFFEDILNEIADTEVCDAIKTKNIRIVLAVCGPLWNNGRSNDTNNVRMEPDGARWPLQHADAIEQELNLVNNSLIFLNDFEAIGYCLAAQVDPNSDELCKFTKTILLHEGSAESQTNNKSPVGCLGAGTGLGACFLTPTGSGRYQINPSEAGMTETFSPRSDEEWELLKYLKNDEPFVEIEQIVSGPGFVRMLKFYSQYRGQPLTKELEKELADANQDDAPAVISRHAEVNQDPLCLQVVDTFLDVFGRTLGTIAQSFLPYRGLYVTGGILPKLAWRWQNNKDNLLIRSYLNQGPKMSATVGNIPLSLIDDDDLGVKGCLYYMTINS